MSIAQWLVTSLELNMPAGFRLAVEKSEEYRGRGPWFDVVRENVVRWEGVGGKSFRVNVWSPEPQRPGQPMQAVSQREVAVNGHPAMLVETSIFEGVPRHSFVIFMNLNSAPVLEGDKADKLQERLPESVAESRSHREMSGCKLRIEGEGMVREEFESIFARLEYLSTRNHRTEALEPSAPASSLQEDR